MSSSSSTPTPTIQSNLNVTPVSETNKKSVPAPSKLGLVCQYSPSADGVDENLLILFHGFGEHSFIMKTAPHLTSMLFLFRSPALPKLDASSYLNEHILYTRGYKSSIRKTRTITQTPTNSYIIGARDRAVRNCPLRCPLFNSDSSRIPYLLPSDPPAYQYFPLYTLLGEPISAPNPTAVLERLVSMLKYLVNECQWPEDRIHLFGFGQGGSVAIELARSWAREQMNAGSKSNTGSGTLASVTTVSGPLLSHPTPNAKPSLTPLLIVHRPRSNESGLTGADVRALKKVFGGRVVVEEIGDDGKEGMPASRNEWLGIMRFWADVLARKIVGEGIYKVG